MLGTAYNGEGRPAKDLEVAILYSRTELNKMGVDIFDQIKRGRVFPNHSGAGVLALPSLGRERP